MANRLVSVGDDFTLPAAVKVANTNLPAHVQPAALSATYGKVSALNVDAYSRSDNAPNGTVTAMSETGQAADLFGAATPFFISGGMITTTHSGTTNSAAYWQTTVAGDKVRRVFAVVNSTPTQGGQLALVLPAAQWRAGGTGPLGPAGIHYVVSTLGDWHVGYWTGSSEETYASGVITDWRDSADHYVEVAIDTVTSTATITHPDGSISTITDARIAANISKYAILESYSTTGTALSFGIKRWGASTRAPQGSDPYVTKPDMKALEKTIAVVQATGAVSVFSTTETTSVAGTSATAVAAGVTEVQFTVPPSGKAVLDLTAFVTSTSGTAHYLIGLANAGSTTAVTGMGLHRLFIGLWNGNVTTHFLLTGMVPGKLAKIQLRHMSTVADVVSLKIGGANAYPFSITVTPVL